jgi:hypothetical protein
MTASFNSLDDAGNEVGLTIALRTVFRRYFELREYICYLSTHPFFINFHLNVNEKPPAHFAYLILVFKLNWGTPWHPSFL